MVSGFLSRRPREYNVVLLSAYCTIDLEPHGTHLVIALMRLLASSPGSDLELLQHGRRYVVLNSWLDKIAFR